MKECRRYQKIEMDKFQEALLATVSGSVISLQFRTHPLKGELQHHLQ